MANVIQTSVAGIGHNSGKVETPNLDALKQQAERAFRDNATSDKLAGSAVQRLAYACYAEHIRLAEEGVKIVTPLTMAKSKESIREVTAKMVEMFIGKLNASATDVSDKVELLKMERTAKVQLLNRAMAFYAVLGLHSVPFHAFDDKKGYFSVPTAMLIPAKCKPLGRLADNDPIALDGRPGLVMNAKGEAAQRILASVAHVMRVANPPKDRAAQTKDEKADDKGVTAKAANLSVTALAHELCAILTAKDAPKSVKRDALPANAWNDIAMIAKWYNETITRPDFENKPLTAAQIKTATAKTDAAKVATGK